MEPYTPAASAPPPRKHTFSILVLQGVRVMDSVGADVDVMWRKSFREGKEGGREESAEERS